ncbi:MAG: MMPL family transporter [Bacteriovoracaceae bacterium]|nr:MMPL family transporter [Bacteriovoracaceae bacterium]
MQIGDYQIQPRKFILWIVNKPIWSMLLVIFLLAVTTPGIFKIKSMYSPRIWFGKDHYEIKKLDQFEKTFGNDQSITFGFYNPKGVFNTESLKAIRDLTDEVWTLPDIIRVESMTNYNFIESTDDEIIIDALLPEDFEYSKSKIEKLKVKTLNDKVVPDYYLSNDATLSLVHGYLKPSFEAEPAYQKIVEEAEKLVLKYKEKIPGIRLYTLGDASANDAFRRISIGDNQVMLPIMFIFIIVLMFWMFRTFKSILTSLVLIGITIQITYGLLGYLGITYNALLAAIPGILLAICIADSVHILVGYHHFKAEGNNPKQSLLMSLTKNMQPTLLTSVSTAISFFSITLTDIQPVSDLGLTAGIGTLFAWFFTYFFMGALYSLMVKGEITVPCVFHKEDKPNQKDTSIVSKIWASKSAKWINKYKKPIIIIFVVKFLATVAIALTGEVNSDPMKYFGKKVPIRQNYDFTSTKMNGMRGIDLVIDSGKEDGVKSPEFLRKVDAFAKWLESDPDITNTKSSLDIIKKMHQTLNNDDKAFHSIPDKQETVAEVLFLYQMGLPQGMDLNNQISLDNRKMRFRVIWKIETSKESQAKSEFLLAKAPEFGLEMDTGGNVPIYIQMNSQVVKSFFSSMSMAILLVSLLLFFVFKDFYLAMLAMLPNVIPLTLGAAVMAIFNIYIDIGTSMVCSVCLGIAVDDTIHFVTSYKNYRKTGLDAYNSVIETFSITGKALVSTTTLLVIGFGVFVFADFVPNRNFGIFCSIILMYALITDLLFLPAILLQFDKKKEDPKISDPLANATHS